MQHFILVFTVCQNTHLGASSIQRVNHLVRTVLQENYAGIFLCLIKGQFSAPSYGYNEVGHRFRLTIFLSVSFNICFECSKEPSH